VGSLCVQMVWKSDVNHGERSFSAFVYTKRKPFRPLAKRICKSSTLELVTRPINHKSPPHSHKQNPGFRSREADHVTFASRPFLTTRQGQQQRRGNLSQVPPKARSQHSGSSREQSRPYISFHHITSEDDDVLRSISARLPIINRGWRHEAILLHFLWGVWGFLVLGGFLGDWHGIWKVGLTGLYPM
jgi:hypothetical protein